MAKAKVPLGVQNRHIYTRASYLYQAAAFLATASLQPSTVNDTPNSVRAAANSSRPGYDDTAAAASDLPAQPASHGAADDDQKQQQRALRNMSRSLLADMRAVTRKVLIRPCPVMKRSVCRYCDALLIEGRSCDASVGSASRRKPWATDVLTVRCRACAGVKRFPVGETTNRKGGARRRKLARGGGHGQEADVAAEETRLTTQGT